MSCILSLFLIFGHRIGVHGKMFSKLRNSEGDFSVKGRMSVIDLLDFCSSFFFEIQCT